MGTHLPFLLSKSSVKGQTAVFWFNAALLSIGSWLHGLLALWPGSLRNASELQLHHVPTITHLTEFFFFSSWTR